MKGKRNWKKYNSWRTRDNELMIRNLRKHVSAMPDPFKRRRKRKNGRGRPPVDYVSVIMSLLLKVILQKSYREIYSLLKADKSLRKLAGITRLPHYNTMNDYMQKLPTRYLDSLISRLYVEGLEKRDVQGGGRLMARGLQPQQERCGTAFACRGG